MIIFLSRSYFFISHDIHLFTNDLCNVVLSFSDFSITTTIRFFGIYATNTSSDKLRLKSRTVFLRTSFLRNTPFFGIFDEQFPERESQFRKCARATHSSFNVGVSFAITFSKHRQSACEPFPALGSALGRSEERTVLRRFFSPHFSFVLVSCLSEIRK